MHDSDSQAGNLFSRLISYSPRQGELRGRTALEDYYTEALAWCLRVPGFRKEFISLLARKSACDDVQALAGAAYGEVENHTQLSFDASSTGTDDAEDVEGALRRRFDLVLRSPEPSRDFVIVVENKIQWSFTQNQLPAYDKELSSGRFADFRVRRLVVLSPSGRRPECPETDTPLIPISWPAVQQELLRFSGADDHSHQTSPQSQMSAEQFICAQFANFLKQKGLAPMKLEQTDPDRLGKWISGLEAREDLLSILRRVREEHRDRLGKEARFDSSDDGSRWFGLYNKDGAEYLYVGFRLRDKDGNVGLCAIIQINVPEEGVGKLYAHELGGFKATDMFNFEHPITGTPCDGDAEKIVGWFIETLAAMHRLERLRRFHSNTPDDHAGVKVVTPKQ